MASVLHPSGHFTAWATNSFTNNVAYQTTADSYDNAGYVTNRVWRNASGATNRTQMLSWDARGRLHQVIERGTNNSGFNWTVIYDPMGRRLQTTTILVTNGVVLSNTPVVVSHYFDPLYEFQELGVAEGSQTIWKLMGPDLDGTYGGENGTGGFDAISPKLSLFDPTIADVNGDILGYYDQTQGTVVWNSSRVTAYGAVPDYRPLTLGGSGSLASQYAWRNRATESVGLDWLGANWYDPVSGQFLSPDQFANTAFDPNGYAFGSVGDPLNYFDADGRMGKNSIERKIGQEEGAGIFVWDTVKSLPRMAYETSPLAMPGQLKQAYQDAQNPMAAFQQREQQIIAAYHTAVQSVQNQWQSGAVGQGRLEGYSVAYVGSFLIGVGEERTAVGLEQVATRVTVADARVATVTSAVGNGVINNPVRLLSVGGAAPARNLLTQGSLITDPSRLLAPYYGPNPAAGEIISTITTRPLAVGRFAGNPRSPWVQLEGAGGTPATLSISPVNAATRISSSVIPAGTRIQISTASAIPEWGGIGGAQQIEILDNDVWQNQMLWEVRQR